MDNAPEIHAELLEELAALRQRLGALEATEATAYIAIAELQHTLGELQIVEEELRQQNDELVATRQTVEAERARYEALFHLAPDGYLVTDAAGIIQEANHAVATLLAVSQEELLGKPLVLFVAQEDRTAFYRQLSRLTREQRVQDWECHMQPWKMRPFPAGITVSVNRRPQEQGVALYWLMRDLTERKRQEAELRRAAHFALLGRLAAGVSHEIRNPLGAVFLHVDLLEEELYQPTADSPAQIVESLAAIKTHLARLEDLVQNYLSLVRVSTIQRDVQDLGVMVQAWAAEVQKQAAIPGVTVHLEGLETLGQVAFHTNTLRRALSNLVQNALEAMPHGGMLILHGQSMETQVQLRVRDTGRGIPAARLEQIFEPLYTTKPGGTGLGLYIVQEVVAAHGGQITVQSEVGHGTTFIITLPRVPAEKPLPG